MDESICHDSINDFPEIAPFDPTKKKKQKNKVVFRHHTDDALRSSVDRVDHGVEDDEEVGVIQQSNYPLEGNEHDYPYRELLRRLLSSMHKDSPEPAGDRQRTVIRPPQVLSDAIAQTVFVNFMDLCKTPLEHVKAYMLKEMNTVGSLDGEDRLVVKGRFAPSNFDDLLQRYIDEYVLCNCCRSPDTILAKESRFPLLQCEMCGEERSVPPVSAGYSTHVGRRKRQTFPQ
ncbi:hypothetical protein RND81_05G022800 [Saponaria officinalis]|uniref:Eukaryotic translation initiation factor 2 subunit beta n=1 Tax=Saponaria officinalis TaxID=3572 RepID=A0AAW1KT01_SAPOF